MLDEWDMSNNSVARASKTVESMSHDMLIDCKAISDKPHLVSDEVLRVLSAAGPLNGQDVQASVSEVSKMICERFASVNSSRAIFELTPVVSARIEQILVECGKCGKKEPEEDVEYKSWDVSKKISGKHSPEWPMLSRPEIPDDKNRHPSVRVSDPSVAARGEDDWRTWERPEPPRKGGMLAEKERKRLEKEERKRKERKRAEKEEKQRMERMRAEEKMRKKAMMKSSASDIPALSTKGGSSWRTKTKAEKKEGHTGMEVEGYDRTRDVADFSTRPKSRIVSIPRRPPPAGPTPIEKPKPMTSSEFTTLQAKFLNQIDSSMLKTCEEIFLPSEETLKIASQKIDSSQYTKAHIASPLADGVTFLRPDGSDIVLSKFQGKTVVRNASSSGPIAIDRTVKVILHGRDVNVHLHGGFFRPLGARK